MAENLVEALRLNVEYRQADNALANASRAADAIEELEEKAQAYAETLYAYEHPWIPVTERLPEHGKRVLVTNGGGFVCELFLAQNGKWQRGGVDMFFMTPAYWMPLPSPPKEDESEDDGMEDKNEHTDKN